MHFGLFGVRRRHVKAMGQLFQAFGPLACSALWVWLYPTERASAVIVASAAAETAPVPPMR